MNKFSDYLETISKVNDLKNNLRDEMCGEMYGEIPEDAIKIQWLFHCGMLFSSKDQWWKDFGLRKSLHEGIDIGFFKFSRLGRTTKLSFKSSHKIDNNLNHDKIYCFNDSIKIPAMDDGIILNICDDFLGKTIVIRHKYKDKINKSFNRQVLFVYAHILPEKKLTTGFNVKKNNVIAKVCNTYKNSQMPCHLHFSCFETPNNIQYEDLNWNLFAKSLDINIINPIFL